VTRGTGHAPCALTVRSLRAAHARTGAVTRSTVARWGLAGGKVLSMSTGGVQGWRQARRAETGLTEGVERRWGGGKWIAWRRSSGRAASTSWRHPRGGPMASGGGGEKGCGHGAGAGQKARRGGKKSGRQRATTPFQRGAVGRARRGGVRASGDAWGRAEAREGGSGAASGATTVGGGTHASQTRAIDKRGQASAGPGG
jgi:hypothetical protein